MGEKQNRKKGFVCVREENQDDLQGTFLVPRTAVEKEIMKVRKVLVCVCA